MIVEKGLKSKNILTKLAKYCLIVSVGREVFQVLQVFTFHSSCRTKRIVKKKVIYAQLDKFAIIKKLANKMP